jgi:hypothetical protein
MGEEPLNMDEPCKACGGECACPWEHLAGAGQPTGEDAGEPAGGAL